MTFCWTSLAIIIILFALLVSISRMLMPLLADYRPDLEQLASEQLGRPVKLESLNAEWVGLWPRIHLSGVRVQSKADSKDWLQVSDVWLSLDLLSLLSKGQLDTRRVRIDGLHLDVQRINDAVYVVNGEPFRLDQNSPDDQADLLQWLFTRDRLQMQDSRFAYKDERYSSQAIELSDVNVSLQNSNGLHHAYGHFSIPAQRHSRLSFVIDMHGDMLQPQNVFNDLYLQGDLYVSSGMQEWLQPIVNIEQGAIKLKLWGAGSLQRLERVSADVHAQDLAWSVADKNRQEVRSEIDELQARVFWSRHEMGWNLDVEDFTLLKQDRKWPQSEIHLLYRDKPEQEYVSLEGAVDFVRLEDVSGLLSGNLPHTLAISEQIRQLDMQGSLEETKFRISRDRDGVRDLYFSSVFENFGFEPWRSLPGVRGLDGRAILTHDKGVLKLDSADTVLDFGDLFKDRLTLRDIRGDVYWKSGAAGVELSFDGLAADNEHVETISRAAILVPADGGSPFIDMSVDFSNGQVRHAANYLPRRIMGKQTVKWLDKAFVQGRVSAGKMIFHGRSADFPFAKEAGTFVVDFDIEDMQLDYADLWPHLHEVDASVRFHNNSLLVNIHRGTASQVGLESSLLKIESLGSKAVLNMDLNFSGRTQQLIKYLHDSPAGEDARTALNSVSTDGNMDSQVKLSIPLAQPRDFRLQGHTHIKEGDLRLQEWQFELTEFKGDLHYAYDGKNFTYTSNNMQGQYLGRPAQLNVSTKTRRKQAAVIVIDMHSRLGLSQLLDGKLPHAGDIFRGDSNWKIALNLQDKGTTLMLESNLLGEQIELPDGFSKQSGQKRNLRIQANIDQAQIEMIGVEYGDTASARFRLTGKKNKAGFSKGAIRFGKGKVVLPSTDGLVVNGQLDTIAVDKWLSLFGEDDGGLSAADAVAIINKVDLLVGRLIVGQLQYNKLSVIANHRKTDVLVTVGADEVAGQITIPVNGDTLTAIDLNLKYLYLKTPAEKLESSVTDPRKLPAIRFVSQKLFLNGNELGNLVLDIGKIPHGLKIDKLELKGKLMEVSAAGSWQFRQSWHESTFSMNLKTPAIGEAMELFGFQASIDDGEASAQLQASWSGPPHWFEMKRLNGSLQLSINKGQLRDIDPGGGRIFGLLSVQSLQRRLFLDFSDVFKKGFSFDKIAGSFSIADGDAYTNDLFLDGPAARIDIAGRIGLAAEDYDEEIIVTPKLSSSIPVLGLAAGPQVAIGLFLTEKILRKDINKMSRTRYNLTGSWDTPEIRKITVEIEQDDEFEGP